jgi:hypothetical protein
MPSDLNTAIEASLSKVNQSKSAFIRESIRQYLREMSSKELTQRERGVGGIPFGTLVEPSKRPWGLFTGWFLASSLTATYICLYCLSHCVTR